MALSTAGPAEELNKTMHTQPALLAASYAVWRIINHRQSCTTCMLAGHSFGEYTALVCAKSLAFTDAIKLVAPVDNICKMPLQEGVGAMAAIWVWMKQRHRYLSAGSNDAR